jgi:hypothetical protein
MEMSIVGIRYDGVAMMVVGGASLICALRRQKYGIRSSSSKYCAADRHCLRWTWTGLLGVGVNHGDGQTLEASKLVLLSRIQIFILFLFLHNIILLCRPNLNLI